MKTYDVIIIGAGAAGIFAAGRIPKNKSVCILDAGATPLRRVAISGGGKCNFTNTHASYTHYFGKNPDFTRGALARFSGYDMLDWCKIHNIKMSEKSAGQYFADDSKNIINALMHDAKNTDIILNTPVKSVTKNGDVFNVLSENGTYTAKNVCIATGGVSYPNIGNGDVGLQIAKSFGHKIIPVRPALCGIKTHMFNPELSGISMPVEITISQETIADDMLFTHWGLGGPAIYRATVRDIENGFTINLLPNCDARAWLIEQKRINGRKQLKTILATKIPERVVANLMQGQTKNIADYRDDELLAIANGLRYMNLTPQDFALQTFATAEVTRGGISTDNISSKTFESKICPNLYFIGECMDIAGDLGGYNLHWAWATANAFAENFLSCART